MESTSLETELVQRLPWHKPEVTRLVISLNTQNNPAQERKTGSGEDLGFFEPFATG